jgi:hypothetical protein
MSAVQSKVQRTLGFTENEGTSADEDGEHPYYHGDYGVPQGDDETETRMALPSNTHTLSGNTSRPASINLPSGRKRGRQSYIPE